MQMQAGSSVPDGLLEPTGLGCLVIVARHHGLHLTVSQLIHDNMLTGPEVSVAELIKAASGAGLKAKAVHLTWNALDQLKKALPAIVRLEHGGCMVLLRLEGTGDTVRLVLQDPDAGDDALLLIDRAWFEKVWTGEVVLVTRNYASNTIESRPSVPSDLRPGARNTSHGVPTSLANVHPELRVRGDKSHFGLPPARDEARVHLGSSEPLIARSASALAQETRKDLGRAIVEPAPITSAATEVLGQEHTFSQVPTNLIPSSSSTRQFIALSVGAVTTVIIWVSILTIRTPVFPSIANLVQSNSLKISNVDRRESNKTDDQTQVDSDIGPKSKSTNFLSTNSNGATRALDRQSNQGGASTEMPPAIEPKPLQPPANSVNRTETKSNLKPMAVQQLSNGDQISRSEYQSPTQREINKTNDRTEVDSDIGPKSKNTDFLSTNGNDATRALDRQSNQGGGSAETPPAIEPKPPQPPADSVNRTETKSNLKTTVDVQQLSNGDSPPEYQPPIQREINKTKEQVEVDSDTGSKSKNTNFLSTNGNDATRAPDGQSNQSGASTEMPRAIEPKPLQTPANSANRIETKSDLKTTADVQQLSNGDRISRPEYQPPIQREINKTNDRAEVDSDTGPKSKNTEFLLTNSNDATRALTSRSNQRRASTENLPATESKSLRTSVDSVNRGDARFNLKTTADVLQVQQRLVKLGYLPFLPDGVWGPHSIQALSAFRATAGLGSGDQWDRKTEDMLFATTAPKATAPTASTPAASPLQLPRDHTSRSFP